MALARSARKIGADRAALARADRPVRLVLLICRPHDIDLYLDIWKLAQLDEGLEIRFWIRKKALEKFPVTKKLLKQHGMQVDFVARHGNLSMAVERFREIDALLNTVETSFASHKIAFRLVQLANAAGILTYTLQHAFENIGLTSTDPAFDSPNITFAAGKIFTWGPVDKLTGRPHPETVKKCVPVGCPKLHLQASGKTADDRERQQPLIAIFEGLHAKRFDEGYTRKFFMDLQESASRFRDLLFILKPHPNVLARSSTHTTLLNELKRVQVIDPAASGNAFSMTTPELLDRALAVITTPSTVALDAAINNTPAAVTRYHQPMRFYEIYEPLPLLRSSADWQRFLEQVMNDPKPLEIQTARFLARKVVPGNAAEKILQIIKSDCLYNREKTGAV